MHLLIFKPGSNYLKRISDFVWLFLSLFYGDRRHSLPDSPKRILVFIGGFLGDVVTLTPALKLLKENFQGAEIDLFTNPNNRDYLKNIPYVDNLFFLKDYLELRNRLSFLGFIDCVKKLRRKRYDIVLEMTGKFRKQIYLIFLRYKYVVGIDETGRCLMLDKGVTIDRKHKIDVYIDVVKRLLELYGRNTLSIDKKLYNPAGQTERQKISSLLEKERIGRFVVIHPTASFKAKRWPEHRFLKVINFLTEKGLNVILIGSKSEWGEIEDIRRRINHRSAVHNWSGILSINEIIALMEKAILFLGNDSGPMHLAKTAGLKSIILFGPGDHIMWGYPDHIILRKDLVCSPCSQFGFNICLKNISFTCEGLQGITPEEVINTIGGLVS